MIDGNTGKKLLGFLSVLLTEGTYNNSIARSAEHRGNTFFAVQICVNNWLINFWQPGQFKTMAEMIQEFAQPSLVTHLRFNHSRTMSIGTHERNRTVCRNCSGISLIYVIFE